MIFPRNRAIWRSTTLPGLLVAALLVACQFGPPSATPSPAANGGSNSPTALPTLTTAGLTPPGATQSSGDASPVVSPVIAESPEGFPTPPPRDLIDLNRRLRSLATAATAAPTAVSTPTLGSEYPFWVANQQTKNYFQIQAALRKITTHVDWFVQDGIVLADSDLTSASNYFEGTTYPTEHRLFGSEAPNGGDGRMTILIGHIPDVGGYFSSADEYPRSVDPYSNQRQMIYLNVDAVRPGSPDFNNTVAHEFQHMIQFNVHRNQDAWINEGAAELAAQSVTGTPSAGIGPFEQQPQTQLNAWAADPSSAIAHYGAAYLFMRYTAEQFGGFQAVGKVVAEPGRSIAVFSAFFQSLVPPRTFDDVFADWVAANELDSTALAKGQYGYRGLSLKPALKVGPTTSSVVDASATQYGAVYYQLAVTSPLTLAFSGASQVKLIGADPHAAAQEWWSNRGDSIDTRLTRPIDLTGVAKATLNFWTWYSIEKDYDYAYVEVSKDGGRTWDTLAAPDTTSANPNGQNYGHGFTGTSGGANPSWISESVDLGSYVGQKILLRFEYVTDDSYNADGFAIDNIAIPEIGFQDNASTDDGWTEEGFLRTNNRIPENYLVEVMSPTLTPPVQRMAVVNGTGSLSLSPAQNLVVAVAGLAPFSTQTSTYELSLKPR